MSNTAQEVELKAGRGRHCYQLSSGGRVHMPSGISAGRNMQLLRAVCGTRIIAAMQAGLEVQNLQAGL